MQIQPYLFFEGRCEEALAFYKQVFNAQVEMLMRFGESPDKEGCGDMPADKVMPISLPTRSRMAVAISEALPLHAVLPVTSR